MAVMVFGRDRHAGYIRALALDEACVEIRPMPVALAHHLPVALAHVPVFAGRDVEDRPVLRRLALLAARPVVLIRRVHGETAPASLRHRDDRFQAPSRVN
jgi:hypothetical protein